MTQRKNKCSKIEDSDTDQVYVGVFVISIGEHEDDYSDEPNDDGYEAEVEDEVGYTPIARSLVPWNA